MGWLMHILGLDDASGPIYLAWSGPVADLGLLGAAVTVWWRHTCHVGRCWRFAVHPVTGTPFKTCRKHHPAVPDRITAAHIAEAHEQARAEQ